MIQGLSALLGVIVYICSLSVFAAWEHPDYPGIATGSGRFAYVRADDTVQIIKLGDTYLFATKNRLKDGSFYGRYDARNPDDREKSTLVISFPFTGTSGWNFNVGVTGFMLTPSNTVFPVFHPSNNNVNNSNYPFRWQIGVNGFTGHLFYNRTVWVPALTPNYLNNDASLNNPQGTQIQDNIKEIAEYILANPYGTVTFRWLVVYYGTQVATEASLIRSLRGGTSVDSDKGYRQSDLLVNFKEQVEPFNLFVDQAAKVTPSGLIAQAMEACEVINESKISCPILRIPSTSLPGYTFALEESDTRIYLQLNGKKVTNKKIDLSTINDSTDLRLIIEPRAIITKLGANKELTVSNWPQMSIYPTSTIQFKTKFSLFDTLKLEMVVNQLSIIGRDSANQCAANTVCGQGTVGQDSEIRLPFVIRQLGSSKATSVSLQVKGEKIKFQDEWRCAFSNVTNQKVAIPLMLVFRHPLSTQHYSINDGCAGKQYNISNNNQSLDDISRGLWLETLKNGEYIAELWLDMVFRLSDSSVQQDSQGRHWEGAMTAKGEIEVQAVWNL